MRLLVPAALKSIIIELKVVEQVLHNIIMEDKYGKGSSNYTLYGYADEFAAPRKNSYRAGW